MRRRNLITTIGVAGSSMLAVGSANARRNDTPGRKVAGEFNVDFNPAHKDEIEQFVYNSFKQSEKANEEESQKLGKSLRNQMNPKQKQAVAEFLRTNARLRITREVSNTSASGITQNNSKTVTTRPLLPEQANSSAGGR